MRVLFTGDWQLGAGRDLGHGDHGPGSRFYDQTSILDRIADLAVDEGIQLVALLGDVFEHSKPYPHEILAVQGFVRRMLGSGIRVICLQGNHDSRGAALPTALEIFAADGCAVALQPSLYPLGDVVFAALPWTPPSVIVSAMPDVARDDVNDAAAQALAAGAKVLLERARIEYPDAKPVLLGHWSISGAALPSGLDTALLREPVIPLESLSESGYALAAFSHIHKAQVLASGPTPVFYTGSPQVNRWDEAEGDHGVWVYDSAAAGSLQFRPIEDNRRFITLDPELVDLGPVGVGFSEPPGDVAGAVVRVRYSVSESLARKVDQAKIRADLMTLGASKVILRPTVIREERARVAEMRDDLSEAAALDLWIQAQGIDTTTLARLLREQHGVYLQGMHQ